MKLPITLACCLYDRTFGLRDGTVPVEGVELNFLPMMPVETFRRQGRHAEFDACEFSLSTLMALHSRGDRRFVGIPVFPSRRFRHEHVWINTSAGIRSAALAVGQAVNEAVIADTRVEGASGLSVFLPGTSGAATAADYTGASYRFLSDTRWGQFIAGVNNGS